MGEAAITAQEAAATGMEFRIREPPSPENNNASLDAGATYSSSSVVRWERFLPKMLMRVLLVEADDSTRQIIAALLRKCSYRVAAVSDGLKAWEVLRGSPCSIDLILTEVDLPLISGYALLTLIMDHEICKNIPVIMMSSYDSVSTVYKCMLRGAADFLVKPVRNNELKNLWLHVWRKQASASGLGPLDESIGQKKDEATSENNVASGNHSSRCVHRSRECSEKGSDAQSSCTKPESSNNGDEGAKQVNRLSRPISRKRNSDGNLKENRSQEEKISQNDNDLGNYSGLAIDLIGAFDNHLDVASNIAAKKFETMPQLDLSLRRSNPSGSVDQANEERTHLNHSEASPFSRYISKPAQLGSSTLVCNQQNDHETIYERRASDHFVEYNCDMKSASQKHVEQPETGFHLPNREISQPIPMRSIGYENGARNGCDDSRVYCAKARTDSSCHPSDCQTSSSQHVHSPVDRRNSNSVVDHAHKTEQNGGFYQSNGNMNHHVSVMGPPPLECGNEESHHRAHEEIVQRSLQREVALTKFRLKRKERCFEKKVRYESRKKLAEQRPRVKGQFVRQVANDAPHQTGDSLAA